MAQKNTPQFGTAAMGYMNSRAGRLGHRGAENVRRVLQLDGTVNERRVEALRRLKAAHAQGELTSQTALYENLKAAGLEPADIHKLCLLSQTDGFFRLLNSDENTPQADLDNFVRNARRQTGLAYTEILSLLRDLCSAFTIRYAAPAGTQGGEGQPKGGVYTVPAAYYAEDLEYVRKARKQALDEKKPLSDEALDRLTRLVAIGVPRAKYYMAHYLAHCRFDTQEGQLVYKKLQDDCAVKEYLAQDDGKADAIAAARQLLEEAAQEGDALAAAEWGDYCFEAGQWETAYEMYTGYGSLAYNTERKDRIARLLNWQSVSKRVLIMNAVLLLLTAVFCAVGPFALGLTARPLWQGLILLSSGIMFLYLVGCYRANPFGRHPGVTVYLYLAWIACALLGILT